MNKYWKIIALERLEELKNRTGEIKHENDILSVVELIEMPADLKKDLLAGPINLGIILPPVPIPWAVDTTEKTIEKMTKKIRNYSGEEG